MKSHNMQHFWSKDFVKNVSPKQEPGEPLKSDPDLDDVQRTAGVSPCQVPVQQLLYRLLAKATFHSPFLLPGSAVCQA